MHPTEFYWLLEAKKPQKMYGPFTEEQAEELYQELEDGPGA